MKALQNEATRLNNIDEENIDEYCETLWDAKKLKVEVAMNRVSVLSILLFLRFYGKFFKFAIDIVVTERQLYTRRL